MNTGMGMGTGIGMSMEMNMGTVTLQTIQEAHRRIAPYIHKTPIFTSSTIDRLTGATVFFKCENLQKVGAFKFRGASNAIFSMREVEIRNGVATHSSGNHAQAVAAAAQMRGVPSYIVMPSTSPSVKIDAVKGYGGQITFCEPTLAARESTLKEIVLKTGAAFVHPFDDDRVIAGQGTAMLEIAAETSDLDIVMAPIGGGGLMCGTAIAAKSLKPQIRVIGAEPAGADDAFRSLRDGVLHPSVKPNTIADGLLASLSKRTFSILRTHVDGIATVSDDEIRNAMQFVWQRLKLVIEPSAAVPVAALLNRKVNVTGKRVAIILSGGNVELSQFA